MINGSMFKGFSDNAPQPQFIHKYRFPIWLTIFFFLLISIPVLALWDHLFMAKFLGISCLILVIIALRLWLRSSRINSLKVERFALNTNQIFELERKYPFLKKIKNSEKQILIHRTGLLLAELVFVSVDIENSLDVKIEMAFNFSILLVDNEYIALNGLVINMSDKDSEKHISLEPINHFSRSTLSYTDYKVKIKETNFAKNFLILLPEN